MRMARASFIPTNKGNRENGMKISALWSRSPVVVPGPVHWCFFWRDALLGPLAQSSPPKPDVASSLGLTESSAFVAPGGPQQFTAKISNTSNTAVTFWQVNGAEGGNAATGISCPKRRSLHRS